MIPGLKMIVSAAGIGFIKKQEGFSPQLVRDTKRLMIGYGCNLSDAEAQQYVGKTITEDEGHSLLIGRIIPIEQQVAKMLAVPVTQNQFDALGSFSYNEGWNRLLTSTLMHKLNAGDVTGAADEFGRWIYAGGKVLEGLKSRRQKEMEMFLS